MIHVRNVQSWVQLRLTLLKEFRVCALCHLWFLLLKLHFQLELTFCFEAETELESALSCAANSWCCATNKDNKKKEKKELNREWEETDWERARKKERDHVIEINDSSVLLVCRFSRSGANNHIQSHHSSSLFYLRDDFLFEFLSSSLSSSRRHYLVMPF